MIAIPVVTLVGRGGIEKTSLAFQVLHHVADEVAAAAGKRLLALWLGLALVILTGLQKVPGLSAPGRHWSAYLPNAGIVSKTEGNRRGREHPVDED